MKVQKDKWKACRWKLKHLLNHEIPPDCIVKSCCFTEEHAVDPPPPQISTKYTPKLSRYCSWRLILLGLSLQLSLVLFFLRTL